MSAGLDLEEPLGLEQGPRSPSSFDIGNSNQSEEAIPSSHGTWKCRLAVVAAFICLGVIIAIAVYKALCGTHEEPQPKVPEEAHPLCVHVQAVLRLTGAKSGTFAGMLAEVVSVGSSKDKFATIEQNREVYRKLIADSVGAWPKLSGEAPNLNGSHHTFFQVRVASDDLNDVGLMDGVTRALKENSRTNQETAARTQLALGEGAGAFDTPLEEITRVDEVRKRIAPATLGFLDGRPSILGCLVARTRGGGSGGGGGPVLLHLVSELRPTETFRGDLFFSAVSLQEQERFSTFSLGRSAMGVLTSSSVKPAFFRLHGSVAGAGRTERDVSPTQPVEVTEQLVFQRFALRGGRPLKDAKQRPVLLTNWGTIDAAQAYTQVFKIIDLMTARRVPTLLDFPFLRVASLLDEPEEDDQSRLGHRFFVGALMVAEKLADDHEKAPLGEAEWDEAFMERLRVLKNHVQASYLTHVENNSGAFKGRTLQEAVKNSRLLLRILTGLEEGGATICFESCVHAFRPFAELFEGGTPSRVLRPGKRRTGAVAGNNV